MKVFAINCTAKSGGANVMFNIASRASNFGIETYVYTPYSESKKNEYHRLLSTKIEDKINSKIGSLFGYDSAIISRGVNKIIFDIKKEKPEVIHLHGLHKWSINYKKLFKFLQSCNITVIWTQHDCWSFTGKCPYYTIVDCNKWQKECEKCVQLNNYPESLLFDNSKFMHRYKKNIFNQINNLTLVSVSKWLYKEVNKSFLSSNNHLVIPNAIDTEFFDYRESYKRVKFNLQEKFIILCVASGWDKRKGFDDVIELSNMLMLKKEFQIVIIGVSDIQRTICENHNILAISRTDSKFELREWYSVADVFFNPSIEETFGLVTVEALSCGTPVIGFNSTAFPELVTSDVGFCVEPHDINSVVRYIYEIKKKGKGNYFESCRSHVKLNYSLNQYDKYIDLYFQKVNKNEK